MKLPEYIATVEQQIAEFDVWITASLGEVRDTEKFASELAAVVEVFELVAQATGGFDNEAKVSSTAIASLFLRACDEHESEAEALAMLEGLASLLFLVTGKSDNNSKCQIPLFLRDHAGWNTYPAVRIRGGKKTLIETPLPRVLKAEQIMANVVSLGEFPSQRERLLAEFVHYLLADPEDVKQLWSIGHSYTLMKKFDRHKSLLAPLVVFQVRGSVSASGGHGPEEILRKQMRNWGLVPGVDFNLTDVIVGGDGAKDGTRAKTRAYDFVLPYRSAGWSPRLFVQCQFYAGDSGSVSHKNVDQTSSSRRTIRKSIRDAKFVEYVDGAGYFSSLNGDLKSLLSMADTESFFQIRSAVVRLRREFQRIGFLTPLDVTHALLRANSDDDMRSELRRDGYGEEEIERAIRASLEQGMLVSGTRLALTDDEALLQLVRSVAILDAIAIRGRPFDGDRGTMRGSVLIPGYGAFFGMRIADAIATTIEQVPGLRDLWVSPDTPSRDLQWLVDRGHAMLV